MNTRSDLRVEIERLSGIEIRADKQIERLESQLFGLYRELEALKENSSLTQSPGSVTKNSKPQWLKVRGWSKSFSRPDKYLAKKISFSESSRASVYRST